MLSMAFSGEAEAVPEPGTGQQAEAWMCIGGGGGGSPEGSDTVLEKNRPVVAAETTSRDLHEAVAPPEQQGARMSTWEEGQELLPAAAKEEGDGGHESAREKLKRHRLEMAGKVWVPEMWGKEKLLNDWMDCSAFDRPLVQAGLLTARRALVAEACKRRRAQTPPASSSSPLRVQNGCS